MNTISSTDLLPVAPQPDCISAAHESLWTSSVKGGSSAFRTSVITEIMHVFFHFILRAHNVYGVFLQGKDINTCLKTSEREREREWRMDEFDI